MSSPRARAGAQVVVVGGGNAGLCAALSAHEAGAAVTIIEAAPRAFRGGNTRHTRNIRTAHESGDDYVTGAYRSDEFIRDLEGVTDADTNWRLARLMVDESTTLTHWMAARGVRWQQPLAGTLHLARTNHFFLGGGKAMLNNYYRRAERLGITVRYDTELVGLDGADARVSSIVVASAGEEATIRCDALVVAAGGFEANLEWLRQNWGDRIDNFVVRGTPFNRGRALRLMLDAGAAQVGNPRGAHAIAVDGRSPRFDGGIATRIDGVPIGVVVNVNGVRFYDEGEDIWPKRYAIWGQLLADQPGQAGNVILDSKLRRSFIPGMYPALTAPTLAGLARILGLPEKEFVTEIEAYNRACPASCSYDLGTLDDCGTRGVTPPKSHWALPIDTPPFYAYPIRPGITFTYLGLGIDDCARVLRTSGIPFENVFAAGEVMAGNILTRGYLAGAGLTIGSVFGRLAGREAAHA